MVEIVQPSAVSIIFLRFPKQKIVFSCAKNKNACDYDDDDHNSNVGVIKSDAEKWEWVMIVRDPCNWERN